jgi:phosphoserine aminotransferase
MGNRLYNFNAGPAALPLEVLEQGKEQFVEFEGLGMSLMEVSHRSKVFERLNEETQQLLLELLGLPEGYNALFMGGGASAQFALIPMNFMSAGGTASYVITGQFAEKAYEEAAYMGKPVQAGSSKAAKWSRIPKQEELQIAKDSAYVHITANNTIEGSQYIQLPEVGGVPLIADMTSCILGRQFDYDKLSLFYAGAQKNLGPAGVTVVVVKNDFVNKGSKIIPAILRYETYVQNKSLYNTPPVHAIYMMKLMLEWHKRQGGVAEITRMNETKASLLYSQIDESGGFYKGIIEKPFRSVMNITWRLKDEELEKLFVKESKEQGFEGLSGHRSVGGIRASAYNAVSLQACEALADFMRDFMKRRG